ncbi:tetratricopeptide repeat protein [Streptomyces sp. NPDC001594]|uniref:tetratricopeptide repeat protein n=1 Tax=Streptomyces sp. NPDC001594 TaxID=3364590 RepID=UPI0036C88556
MALSATRAHTGPPPPGSQSGQPGPGPFSARHHGRSSDRGRARRGPWMAGRGPSRQELIRRRRSSGFIGRQGQVAAFRDAMRRPPDEGTQFLFHVRGPAGVGKSTLVRQLETIAREGQAVTAYVDESVADPIEAMEVVSGQFAQQGAPLKAFDKLLATYRQRRHEADAGMGAAAADPASGGAPAPSPSSVVASQLGLVGLGMIPGVGAFTGAVDPNQVAAGADRVRALLSTRLRHHGDVELILSPLDVLTPVFLEELSEAARRHPWIVLFFDTYERTGPMLDTWLRDIIVTDRHGELPANVLVTLAGQSRLAAHCWGDWHDLVTDWPLEVFTDTEARALLTGKGVTDERVVEVILRLSERLPVLVSTLAETQPGSVEEIGDPSGTAVERFLKWETDPARRAAALVCAFPQQLDEDVYRAAVEEEAAELFGWLRSMPFVTDRSGHCRYHEVVRSAMLRLQRRQSPTRWQQLHTRLADAFSRRRDRLEEAPAPPDGWWQDETWRGHRLQETYHRLCADPRGALPDALRELLDAYDHGLTTLRRWADTLDQAARDTESEDLTDWGERLRTALEQPEPGIAVLTLLLAGSRLDTAGRCVAFTLRGRDHRNAERYPEALADYAQALALDTGAARAHYGRGRTHELTERFEEAAEDYTRAIELDPDAQSLVNRGACHFNLGRTEEAMADLDRAIVLAPDSYEAYVYRGALHRDTGRFAEARADFDRAIAAEPDSTWALVIRAFFLIATKRYEEALSDLDRAVELAPEDVWGHRLRGECHWHQDRYEEAVADYTRALELEPDHPRALAGRGSAFRLMGRYGEALADLSRAIELSPDDAWTLAERGVTYQLTDRYEEALSDLDLAIRLKPEVWWALYQRGLTHERLGRYAEALADHTRAAELEPDEPWAFGDRGDVHRKTGQYEEALTDYLRADELRPDNAEELTRCGLARRLLGRFDQALADLTRALALQPDDVWAHYETAVVLRALGRADHEGHLERVVELLTEPEDAEDFGCLVLAHCVWARWDEAERYLLRFLDLDPPRGTVHEMLMALCGLLPLLGSAQPRLLGFCQVVENRLA